MHFFFSRRFLPLFVTQFLGAFNDNFLKNALVVLITYRLAVQTGQNAQSLVAIAVALFILPYFPFSATSGQLADKLDRGVIARRVKLVEVLLMVLASLGFYWGNAWFLILVLFGMGTHSAFFSPVKYALLPQHLRDHELLSGNAWIEAGTFMAILLGTIAGGLLILTPQGELIATIVLLAMAVTGYITARAIPAAPPPEPSLKISYNLFRETWALLRTSRGLPNIHRCILGISWFWFIGATFLAQFPAYASQTLHADETVVTMFLTMFSVGIAIGSFLCSRLLKGQVKLSYLFWATIGMSVFAFDLSIAAQHPLVSTDAQMIGVMQFMQYPAHWRILADLMLLAVCGGVYIVPLYAYLQHHGEPKIMARLIAANNVVNAFYMVMSSVFILAMVAIGASIPQLFMALAVLNVLMAFKNRHFRV